MNDETTSATRTTTIPCECGSNAELVNGEKVYPHRNDLWMRLYYLCPQCKRYVGTHQDGSPLGTPADKETRTARLEVHAMFDPLWKSKSKIFNSRRAAYNWLANKMNRKEVHIGQMNKEQAKSTCNIIKNHFKGKR